MKVSILEYLAVFIAFFLFRGCFLTILGRRATHITSDFIASNGLRKATNIRRGEIPVQKFVAVGIPSDIYRSPTSIASQVRGSPMTEVRAAPESPRGVLQTAGKVGVLTRGGIKFENSLIARPTGTNHFVSLNSHRETGTRILN